MPSNFQNVLSRYICQGSASEAQLLYPTSGGHACPKDLYNISTLFCNVLALDNILFIIKSNEYYSSSIINNFEIQKIVVPLVIASRT
jgi:hypothetical protein